MQTTTSKQVLYQVLEPLRGSATPHDAAILAFQLLAWAHLSAKQELEPAERIEAAVELGSGAIVDVMAKLGSRRGLIGQAFSNAASVARHADTHVLTAARVAKGLADAGVFQRFQVTEVVVDLVPWVPGYQTLSPQLVRLVSDLAVEEDIKSVYCPWEYSGQFVSSVLWANPPRVHAESLLAFPLPALISLFCANGTVDIEVTDPLRAPSAVADGRLERFAATIACPPMGTRLESDVTERDLYGRFPIPKATATGLMIQHIVAQTHGIAGVVVSNSFLFGSGTDREVREYLLSQKHVQAVVSLPGGLLSDTNIPVAVLVLNTRHPCDTVKFVDATQDYFRKPLPKGRSELINTREIVAFCRQDLNAIDPGQHASLGAELATSVAVDAVLDNEAQLQVNRYVMSTERHHFQRSLEAQPMVALGSIASITTPLANKDRNVQAPDGIPVLEVGAADLPPTGYIQEPSKELRIRLLKTSRSGNAGDVFLRPHDVVLITKGSSGKVGIVPNNVPEPGPGGWVAGQSAVVLRANKPNTDLRALALLLRSELGQELLASITSGSSIQMISTSALKNLAVPALSHEFAARAVRILDRQAELQQQIDSLRQEQSAQADSLWADLFAEKTIQGS